jgi:hypothetical protein
MQGNKFELETPGWTPGMRRYSDRGMLDYYEVVCRRGVCNGWVRWSVKIGEDGDQVWLYVYSCIEETTYRNKVSVKTNEKDATD